MESWHIIVLLGVTIIVYATVFLKKTEAVPSFVNEMDETLEQFAAELEEENKQVIQHILKLRQHYEEDTSRLTRRVEELEQKLFKLEQSTVNASNPNPVLVLKKPEEDLPQPLPSSIKSRYEEIFNYHEQGKSVDWICKKTGMPKGEVQLIMKLARQEEKSRAEK